jgi:5-methylcytosine-specific restriction endonuclease McrA
MPVTSELAKFRDKLVRKYRYQLNRLDSDFVAKEQKRQRKDYENRTEQICAIKRIAWARNKSKRNSARRSKDRTEEKHQRRAKLLGTPRGSCVAKIKLLRLECFCRWCCDRLTDKNFSIDHIIPLVRGGKHIPDNLAAACISCNLSKNRKLIGEWWPAMAT